MEGISDIRISGIDEKRPPQIRKEPYINLFFKLSHKAPEDWCEDFNQILSKTKYKPKIDRSAGLFVETWVRKPDEIEPMLDDLKKAVSACNLEYIAKIEARANSVGNDNDKPEDKGEQGQLNQIIAALNFDD